MTFKLGKFGPKKWRKILGEYEAAINMVVPKSGLGIECEMDSSGDGTQISTIAACQGTGGGSGDGGGSSSVNVYGAHNGAPAIFHFLQSSPPSAVP